MGNAKNVGICDFNSIRNKVGKNDNLQIWGGPNRSEVAAGSVLLECWYLLNDKWLVAFVISVVLFQGQAVLFYSLYLNMKVLHSPKNRVNIQYSTHPSILEHSNTEPHVKVNINGNSFVMDCDRDCNVKYLCCGLQTKKVILSDLRLAEDTYLRDLTLAQNVRTKWHWSPETSRMSITFENRISVFDFLSWLTCVTIWTQALKHYTLV
jgi:hypothetical protein